MKTVDKKKSRVWEIDALRGYLILWVVIFHLYDCIYSCFMNGIFTNVDPVSLVQHFDPQQFFFSLIGGNVVGRSHFYRFMEIFHKPFVDMFFVVSGISYGFSRNNLKGGIRLLCAALFVSAFTKILVWYTGDESQFIRFGVLHCYAACHLIYYYLLEDRSDKAILLAAVISLILGYYLHQYPIYTNSALLVPFGIYEYGAIVRDYWPVFPMLGWFLLGIVIGRHWYKEKETRFPMHEHRKWHKPLCFLGRHSGLIYCGHMVVFTILFCGIGHIFNLY